MGADIAKVGRAGKLLRRPFRRWILMTAWRGTFGIPQPDTNVKYFDCRSPS
jgi:hypothetical protein